MLASLGAGALATILKYGGIVAGIIGVFFMGRLHGLNSAQNAQQKEQNQDARADLETEQKVTSDMTNAQINAPKTLNELAQRAKDHNL